MPTLDPLALVGALRRQLPKDALLFTDVTVSEHLAAEHYRVDATGMQSLRLTAPWPDHSDDRSRDHHSMVSASSSSS